MQLLNNEPMLRCFQDLSVANESDELIFPGLELCFNQMDCLHASFFSGVFVASMAYRSRD